MYIEITREAFKALVPSEMPNIRITDMEYRCSSSYYSHGVRLKTVENHLSGTMQYYIQDINA